MKKFLASLLVMVLAIALVPQGLFTIDVHAATSGNFTYTVSNGKATITDFPTDYTGALTIPSTLGGYPVTSIGSSAFYNCTGLTSVTIPDSVTSIGSSAFYNCTGLTSVTIGNSVTSIGFNAFYGCSGLTSVVIPDSVTSIAKYAFYGCSGLTSVVIPDSVTSIGDYAFRNCTSLTSITIPDSVTSIGQGAFSGCTGLTSVTIGDSFQTISSSAFSGCTGLTSVVIPDSVTSIGSNAFEGCTGLTSITIPDSVTSIGSFAFYKCTGLTSIMIPDSVTSIGPYAFHYTAYYNNSANWQNQVLYIGNHVIVAKTPNLGGYSISPNTKTIAEYAFEGCTGLTSIIIPGSVTSIGYRAFYGCTGLTSVTFDDSFQTISSSAFEGCTGLTSITIPDSVTSIGYRAFSECTGLTSITIPDSVTSIGSSAFYGCTSLESMTLPFVGGRATVNAHLGYIFGASSYIYNSSYVPQSLKTIILSDACTSIDSSAFYKCTGLTSIIIPDSVTSIGDRAFSECTGLTSVRFYSRNQMSKFDSTISNSYRINENINFLCLCKDDQHTYNQESEVICDKCMFSRAPLAPTVAKVTSDSITLMAVDGYEYSIGDGVWTSNPTFTGLDSATEYTFYQRVAKSVKYYASEASAPLTVATGLPYAPGDIDGVEGVTDADAEYLLMYTFFAEDYPVNQPCDFNGDTFVNDADAEHLLMYTFFPEDYPLQ